MIDSTIILPCMHSCSEYYYFHVQFYYKYNNYNNYYKIITYNIIYKRDKFQMTTTSVIFPV